VSPDGGFPTVRPRRRSSVQDGDGGEYLRAARFLAEIGTPYDAAPPHYPLAPAVTGDGPSIVSRRTT